MDEPLSTILANESLALTATDRIILLHLAQSPAGERIEEIARLTGSKYRWIESEVFKLTRIGILCRVAPNRYAINANYGVKK